MNRYLIPTIGITILTFVGWGVSHFFNISWFTASAFFAITILLLGGWVFEDDLIPGASLHDEKAWNEGKARKEISKNWKVNGSIILILFIAVLINELILNK